MPTESRFPLVFEDSSVGLPPGISYSPILGVIVKMSGNKYQGHGEHSPLHPLEGMV
ncbi:hypothetical protein SERLA73DRAFT_190571 [Serpula lacrymans var. lacrymans S7.3]|uniref:Uncharacterized protein n=1 Tax=Serpula lacrymans var. lacrymans (strain S7.3) TaxID=936435 RepID=F8QFY6_SERL3|nr:hypothetical protein SERLA73DRAFT_190571 [Serpula lacrymans var. lacrymans S7.3]